MSPDQKLVVIILVASVVLTGVTWVVLAEPVRDPTGDEWLSWPERHDPQPYDQDHSAKIYRPGFVHGEGRPPTRPAPKRRHHARRSRQ